MTFLEICQEVYGRTGMSGQISSVKNQTGDAGRIVRYVRSACIKLEARWVNWRFMSARYDFTTSKGIAVYSMPEENRLRVWDINTCYLDDLKTPVYFYDSHNYERSVYLEKQVTQPTMAVINSDNTLQLIGIPDSEYPVQIRYFKQATVLNDNDDMPLLPSQYHLAISTLAMISYANYDEALELKTEALEEFYGFGGNWQQPEPGSWLSQIDATELPGTFINGATTGGDLVVRTY